MLEMMVPCMSLVSFLVLTYIVTLASMFILLVVVSGARANSFISTVILCGLLIMFTVIPRLPSLLQ